jgi:hypothetical protein
MKVKWKWNGEVGKRYKRNCKWRIIDKKVKIK